jgi:outer membrane lipoprotein-sorting protein
VKRGIFLVFGIIFSVLEGFSQEILTAEKFLEMVSERYGGIKDYEAQITILSGTTEMTGTVSHLAPGFLRIDFSRPQGQVIAFNGELLTVYLPGDRAVLNQVVPAARRPQAGGASMASAQGLFLLRRNYVAAFVKGPEPEALDPGSEEKAVRLRLSRRSLAEGFREIILSVNPSTLLIRRIEGRTIADSLVRFDFTNVKTNQGIPEQRFIYDSPASANVYNNFLFRDD